MGSKRVLVAGLSRPHAEALGALIGQSGFDFVGAATTVSEAARLARERRVDVVVADDGFAEDGTEWSARPRGTSGPPVVVLTVSTDQPLPVLLDALHEAAGPPPDREPGATQAEQEAEPDLTRREQTVLTLLGQALPPKQVAHELSISVHTCRGYVKSILAKLESHSILEAVLTAQRLGLLSPGDAAPGPAPERRLTRGLTRQEAAPKRCLPAPELPLR